MSNSSADVIRHLFVPGLLGPVPGLERSQLKRLPRLETLLARADRLEEPVGFIPSLFALFGVAAPPDGDLPTASICFLAETGEQPPAYLLQADALQLHPDRDHLLAFDLVDAPLDADELVELVDGFNAHFGDDGLRLIGSPGGRLYLHSEQPPRVRTEPLQRLIGRNIDGFLPVGEAQRQWRGLLNETQMLCHGLELNQRREREGRPSLGGLWFSGGGVLPSVGEGPVGRLVGDCLVSQGLLSLRPGTDAGELRVDHALDMALMRNDPVAWLQAASVIEGQLEQLLTDGAELQLHPGDGVVYRWHARSARRFWRRKRPLFDYLATAAR